MTPITQPPSILNTVYPPLPKKPNYDFEKRKKEQERKMKQEEKRLRKRENAERDAETAASPGVDEELVNPPE